METGTTNTIEINVKNYKERYSIENFSRIINMVEANAHKIREIEDARESEQREYE